MRLDTNPHAGKQVGLAIAAVVTAAVAGVQLISGSAPLVWLLAAAVALWGLLAQASHVQDSTAMRGRSSRSQARWARR
ncbi:MAG TPA: hypothetical protein VHX16_04405 [Chloroflexota bacterium]|jgi:hypothetical protein|nr:hypothetical protein [Chloroflexota bacterium]